AALPEREKLVVALYYYENLTLREIGEVLGVTESRVSQLHTKAVLRLRSKLAGELDCPSWWWPSRMRLGPAGACTRRGWAAAHPCGPRMRGPPIFTSDKFGLSALRVRGDQPC